MISPLCEQSPVRGCLIIKPWGMSLWDSIRVDLDRRLKPRGVENAYFPLLIPLEYMSKEAEHVEGFAKECAVVTHHRLSQTSPSNSTLQPDPQSVLPQPLVIRPTSETMIWSTFSKWIKSHRELPLRLNQWANVFRWELRPRPFLRNAEFLWQEGHCAFSSESEARQDAMDMAAVYEQMCSELLAIPVTRGVKSPSETFAGASVTHTIEVASQNGWSLQSGTSHYLGTSFASAFDVSFQDKSGDRCLVHGTSWGVSTRLIGALALVHGDDRGLVLPPSVAPVQVVVVPIVPTSGAAAEKEGEAVEAAAAEAAKLLREAGFRTHVDGRQEVRAGAKFYEWERKGVPLRVEIGARDVKNETVTLKFRTGPRAAAAAAAAKGSGVGVVKSSTLVTEVRDGLAELQKHMREAARERLAAGVVRGASYAQMKSAMLASENGAYPGVGMFLVPWKCDSTNEKKIKEESRATIRCYPDAENAKGHVDGLKCFYSGDPATHMALFARSY